MGWSITRIFGFILLAVLIWQFFLYYLTAKRPGSDCSSYTCSILSTGGKYRQQTNSSHLLWEPDGCTLRHRTLHENVQCMMDIAEKKDKVPIVAFAGDSRIRQLRDEFIHQITGNDSDMVANPSLIVNEDWYRRHDFRADFFPSASVNVHFEWSPFIDLGQDSLIQFLTRIIGMTCWLPDILILGSGIWNARDCSRFNRTESECVLEYKSSFQALLLLLERLPLSTEIIWIPQSILNESTINRPKDPFFKVGLKSGTLIPYNNAVKEILASNSGRRIIYWDSLYIASRQLADGLDGVHFGLKSKQQMMQLLMNWICNKYDHDRFSPAWGLVYKKPLSNSFCCARKCS
ncbi:hypothetical protein BV898_18388 [Hypsibius exemplaris]|uniref:CAS1 domain-containing protein 1 n=1 Tax=Hypsibius exemplaris TaxID=2072580 RepID=A0A9X6NHI1_HYPEX|nr:hypothetical protein BV898_18388 [Hypsibius exemplaris]